MSFPHVACSASMHWMCRACILYFGHLSLVAFGEIGAELSLKIHVQARLLFVTTSFDRFLLRQSSIYAIPFVQGFTCNRFERSRRNAFLCVCFVYRPYSSSALRFFDMTCALRHACPPGALHTREEDDIKECREQDSLYMCTNSSNTQAQLRFPSLCWTFNASIPSHVGGGVCFLIRKLISESERGGCQVFMGVEHHEHLKAIITSRL